MCLQALRFHALKVMNAFFPASVTEGKALFENETFTMRY
jgi:hypothetical protein